MIVNTNVDAGNSGVNLAVDGVIGHRGAYSRLAAVAGRPGNDHHEGVIPGLEGSFVQRRGRIFQQRPGSVLHQVNGYRARNGKAFFARRTGPSRADRPDVPFPVGDQGYPIKFQLQPCTPDVCPGESVEGVLAVGAGQPHRSPFRFYDGHGTGGRDYTGLVDTFHFQVNGPDTAGIIYIGQHIIIQNIQGHITRNAKAERALARLAFPAGIAGRGSIYGQITGILLLLGGR